MKYAQIKIYVKNSVYGLDIYLIISGITRYLTTRRRNGLLYIWLKNGRTIGELSRVKPRYSRIEQKKYHYAQHLLKIVNDYLKYNSAI